MSPNVMIIIFFFYGLAFYSMGLAILLEMNKCSDARLRHSLRPLAAFGFLHGAHEWMEMFERLDLFQPSPEVGLFLEGIRLIFLAFSFLSLAAFGSSLLARSEHGRRYSLLLPVGLVSIWGFGLFIMRGIYSQLDLMNILDVWTRYTLAVPGAIAACIGLIIQQREFRRAGLAQFGRDALWAAVAFFWYGIIGQTFTRYSLLPPSNIVNQDMFLRIFGFPVQLMRAAAAILAAVFVIRFLRSFEVEISERIANLQQARLEEARRREGLRGDLLKRVVTAQEAERQRIARELHDETGQALTAIGLGLRGVSTTVRQDAEKAANNLRQLEALAEHSLNELQRLISDLRPSHLDDLGLGATLRWYAGEIQNRAEVPVIVRVRGERRNLSSQMKTALFRVAQEALTNVVKHASANQVMVELSYEPDAVRVVVRDDGCGFDMTRMTTSARRSWGLEGMRERAELLGGKYHLVSYPGEGTRVEVTIPYHEPGQEEEADDGNTRDAAR